MKSPSATQFTGSLISPLPLLAKQNHSSRDTSEVLSLFLTRNTVVCNLNHHSRVHLGGIAGFLQ